MKTVKSSKARQRFLELLRETAKGDEITVTRQGRASARPAPARPRPFAEDIARREANRDALLKRLSKRPALGRKIDWTRSDLYE